METLNNQRAWNYIGQSGKVATIALQHNRKDGGLVVFYGKELLWAEPNVRTAQTISFFIDDELCKIHLTYAPDGRISYEFEIDRKADTALNRIRKTEERNGFLRGLGLLFGIVGVLCTVIGGGFVYNKYTDTKNLRENGRETTARLELYPKSIGKNCTYTFEYNGVACTYSGMLDKVGDSLVLSCGLPARTGDAVLLRFDPNKVMNHTVNWAMPSPECARSLVRRLRDRLLATQPQWCFGRGKILEQPLLFTQAECLAIMAHRLGGFSGMADMYYGEEPMFNNIGHNELTFGFQQKRFDFKDDIGECF